MTFNSWAFAVFLVVVLLLYQFRHHRWRNVMLLAASYFFYGFWDWRFLSLILASTVLDYCCGLALHRSGNPGARRLLLVCSLGGNLGLLGVFKYFNFFAESLEGALLALGLQTDLVVTQIVLPVGISFYTFQTLSYTIDIYRGKMEPTRDFLNFALFVSFFPQLVAGPIERATHLLPQIEASRWVSRAQVYEGGWLIYWGLFKKVFIADNVAVLVNTVYNEPALYSGTHYLLATYAFAVQIYCDFSGYTDIARGVAKLLGFELSLNFNLPYFARDPQDFWRRWHITLSEWLRDYLYIPLGGSRCSPRRVGYNLMITMALGGLWHGAQWHFVFWGIYHGLLLIGYRMAGAQVSPDTRTTPLGNALRILIMFHFTCLGWWLFRVQDLTDMTIMVGRFFTTWAWTAEVGGMAVDLLFFSAPLVAMQILQYTTGDLNAALKLPVWARMLLYVLMYFCISLLGAFDGPQFIYFQF